MRMEGNKAAALPTIIANHVERLICAHRRERKVMLDKQPAGWEQKLTEINKKTMTMVWNKKTCNMATPWYVKRATRIIHGELTFVQGSGKGYELLHLRFEPGNAEDPSGAGAYYLESQNFPRRAVCCINSNAERNGFDLLREAYEGLTHA